MPTRTRKVKRPAPTVSLVSFVEYLTCMKKSTTRIILVGDGEGDDGIERSHIHVRSANGDRRAHKQRQQDRDVDARRYYVVMVLVLFNRFEVFVVGCAHNFDPCQCLLMR